jgi:hypothetical protein
LAAGVNLSAIFLANAVATFFNTPPDFRLVPTAAAAAGFFADFVTVSFMSAIPSHK